MNSKKIITGVAVIAILVISLIGLTGCTTKKSFTYDVETGDKIKIEMNTTDGYDLTAELPIKFSKDDKTISQGAFAKKEVYDTYYSSIKSQSNVKILEEKEDKKIEYFLYTTKSAYNGKTEYNYIIRIKDSSTCFMLGNNESEESARDIFEKLTFSVK